jgi:hypothetical protein
MQFLPQRLGDNDAACFINGEARAKLQRSDRGQLENHDTSVKARSNLADLRRCEIW